MVPVVGVEPTHGCPWQILSLLRLPIPPHRQCVRPNGAVRGRGRKYREVDANSEAGGDRSDVPTDRARQRAAPATFRASAASNGTMSHFHGIELPSETIRAAAAGNRRAHEAIYRAYERPVYTLVRRLILRSAVADEIFQEVFVEILRSIGSYAGEGSFSGWVRSIAVSKCLMYLRSPWHRSLLWLDAETSEATAPALPDDGPGADLQATAQADLERALASLPPLARTVVWLHDVEGYTHGEIAAALGRTIAFSKSQLSRAHRRLRELLESKSESMSCMPASSNC
jgi:RNA polymerase sigma factor (sigma-70 family)